MMRCRPALGTYVSIHIAGDRLSPAAQQHACDQAFAAVAEVQACMSVFDANSDLSRINAGAFARRAGPIHPWLWEVLALAQHIHRLCPAFDPCAAAKCLRFQNKTAPLSDLVLLDDHHVWTTAPLALDLGGIAKGDAVDRAVAALQAHGVRNGSVNAGGDLRVFGSQAQAIYLRQAGSPHQLRWAGMLQDGAVATSANDFVATFEGAGHRRSHLVDPANGQLLDTDRSYSVLAQRCAVADAMTKVWAVTGQADHPAFAQMQAQCLTTA